MRVYRRHLPHMAPVGSPVFLTWNLKGAIPRHVAERLRRQRDELRRQVPRGGESPRERRIREGKLLFAAADEFLDGCSTGPLFLKEPGHAAIVQTALVFGVDERYDLLAWCVMPNHVHVLVTPQWELQRITQGIKGYTSRQINALIRRRGRPLWQDESYDHWARDADELDRIVAYIEYNPVKAGLCSSPAAWPWSSARFRNGWPVGEPYRKSAFPG
jgi:REP element-mobilizing transposase RayT